MVYCRLLICFKINFRGIPSVLNSFHSDQVRHDFVCLIWLCKGYQEMTVAGKEFIIGLDKQNL